MRTGYHGTAYGSLLGGAVIRLGDRASVDEKHEIDR